MANKKNYTKSALIMMYCIRAAPFAMLMHAFMNYIGFHKIATVFGVYWVFICVLICAHSLLLLFYNETHITKTRDGIDT